MYMKNLIKKNGKKQQKKTEATASSYKISETFTVREVERRGGKILLPLKMVGIHYNYI